MMDHADLSCDLIDSLSRNGEAIIVLAEVYVDESNSHDQEETLCLAAYIFLPKKAKRFSKELTKVLRKRGLPYFHMVDCAHGNPPFDIGKEECISVEKNVIRLTKNLTEKGIAISLDKATFESAAPKSLTENFGGQYTYCLIQLIIQVLFWAEDTGFQGKFAYFFEAGHKSQSEANGVLDKMFQFPEVAAKFRYASHSFGGKQDFIPVQAADLLAWLFANHLEKLKQAKLPRKDFVALIRPDRDGQVSLDADKLNGMMDFFRVRYPDSIFGRKIS